MKAILRPFVKSEITFPIVIVNVVYIDLQTPGEITLGTDEPDHNKYTYNTSEYELAFVQEEKIPEIIKVMKE